MKDSILKNINTGQMLNGMDIQLLTILIMEQLAGQTGIFF